jgi:type IV pilus assembly protein PilO
VALVAFLFSPWAQRPAAREQALKQVQDQFAVKQKEVGPLLGMDRKLATAQVQLDDFYKTRLPARNSDIVAELGKLAASNGVRLAGARYEQKQSEFAGFTQVKIEGALEGEYVSTVKFINALERDRMFFILDKVDLNSQQGGSVRLALNLETYIKS